MLPPRSVTEAGMQTGRRSGERQTGFGRHRRDSIALATMIQQPHRSLPEDRRLPCESVERASSQQRSADAPLPLAGRSLDSAVRQAAPFSSLAESATSTERS
jgi:hypothetical protein